MEKRYRVTLTVAERQELRAMVSAGKAAARKLVRARVLLLADQAEGGPAQSDPEIVDALRCGRATVERIRQQFVEEGLEEMLQPKPSARIYERRLDGKAEAHLVALACGTPPEGRSHGIGSLYEAFDPETARALAARLEIHYTPKHGSWLNMAETELSILSRQCLDRRIESKGTLNREVAAWEHDCSTRKCNIDWQFTTADARSKLKRLYPSIHE